MSLLEGIETIHFDAVIEEITERLQKANVTGEVNAIPVYNTAFNPIAESIRATFNAGGIAALSKLVWLKSPSGHKVVVRI